MRRLGRALIVMGLASVPLAALIDLAFGVEVTLLGHRHDAAEEATWRSIRDLRDDPAEIYGVPEGTPLRVILVDRSALIEPPEAPGRRLLPIDRIGGDDPLPVRALRFRSAVAAAGLWILGGLVLLLGLWRRSLGTTRGAG